MGLADQTRTAIEYKNGTNSTGVVVIDETGSNTGVFESQSDDDSEISVKIDANDGDTFTIAYADDTSR